MVEVTRRLDAGAGTRRLLIALECDACGYLSFVQLETFARNLFARALRLRVEAAASEGWLIDDDGRDLCAACRSNGPKRPRKRRGWKR